MATDPLRSRALACLREGRVRVVRATDNERHEVQRVMAVVASSRPGSGPYVAERFLDGRWECTCRGGLRGEPCPHAAAVQLVTEGAIRDLSEAGVNAADTSAKAGHDPALAPVAGPAPTSLTGAVT